MGPWQPDPNRPDELFQDVYKASEGRNPSGLLAAIAFQLGLMGELSGMPVANLNEFHPEHPEDRSGRAVVADALHISRVDQEAAQNPEATATRNAAIAAGDLERNQRLHDSAIANLQIHVLPDARDEGCPISVEMSTNAKLAVREE